MRNTFNFATLLAFSSLMANCLHAETNVTLENNGRLNWPTEVLQHQRPGEKDAAVVTQVAIHPTASLAAVVGDDHIVSLVNLDSGQLEKTLKGHSDWIRSAQFVPAGDRLLTGGADRKILSWDLQTGDWTIFATQPCSIEDMDVSNDGKTLAVVGFDEKLRLYEISSGNLLATITCPCGDMRAVKFSSDDQTIVAGGRCGTLRSWSKINGQWTQADQDIKAHRQRIRSIDFLNDSTVVTCSEDRCIQKCDLTTRKATLVAQTDGRKFDVEVIDESTVACCGSNDRIELFDLNNGTSIGYLEGHKGTVSCIEFHNGSMLSGSFDTQARLWKSQQNVSTTASLDQPATFDLPAIQRSASAGALSPPPSFK